MPRFISDFWNEDIWICPIHQIVLKHPFLQFGTHNFSSRNHYGIVSGSTFLNYFPPFLYGYANKELLQIPCKTTVQLPGNFMSLILFLLFFSIKSSLIWNNLWQIGIFFSQWEAKKFILTPFVFSPRHLTAAGSGESSILYLFFQLKQLIRNLISQLLYCNVVIIPYILFKM